MGAPNKPNAISVCAVLINLLTNCYRILYSFSSWAFATGSISTDTDKAMTDNAHFFGGYKNRYQKAPTKKCLATHPWLPQRLHSPFRFKHTKKTLMLSMTAHSWLKNTQKGNSQWTSKVGVPHWQGRIFIESFLMWIENALLESCLLFCLLLVWWIEYNFTRQVHRRLIKMHGRVLSTSEILIIQFQVAGKDN